MANHPALDNDASRRKKECLDPKIKAGIIKYNDLWRMTKHGHQKEKFGLEEVKVTAREIRLPLTRFSTE